MSHAHDHAPVNFGRAFAVGMALNIGFVAIEAWYGWQAGSLALLADAGHNLSDVAGLALAWAAYGAAKIHATPRHSYGWGKATVLASLANAAVLLIAMVWLAVEAVQRVNNPTPVHSTTVMVVAAIGVVINAVTAWFFASGQRHDLNIRGAFVHMAADALISAGVVVAGALSWWQGWLWIDPVVSAVIAVVIATGTWPLLRESLHLVFDGVPQAIDAKRVEQRLLALPGVREVHDLHIWALSTSANALTAHLVVDPVTAADTSPCLMQADAMLRREFDIEHATLQLESERYASQCRAVRGTQHANDHHAH